MRVGIVFWRVGTWRVKRYCRQIRGVVAGGRGWCPLVVGSLLQNIWWCVPNGQWEGGRQACYVLHTCLSSILTSCQPSICWVYGQNEYLVPCFHFISLVIYFYTTPSLAPSNSKSSITGYWGQPLSS